MTAAEKAGVQRIVLTSCSSVLGPNWEPKPMTESDASDLEGAPDYFYSKRLQEETAFECADRDGVELVFICPSVFIGPYDFRPSAIFPTVTGYLFDPMKLSYPGGVNIIHASRCGSSPFAAG